MRQAEQRSDEEKATQRWGKVYHLQYLPLPQGIWRRSVFFLHVVATDQAQWCIPLARMSRPVMRCAIADCGRQIMVSSATASAIAPLHMRSSLMVLKSPGVAFSSPSPVVLVTMFYFSLLTICNALPERRTFFEQWDMFLQFKYIFQVKSDCRGRIFMNENLIRIPEGTPRAEFVFGIVSELFRNRTMTEIRLPFSVIGVRCPRC
jgi:hypothetical protein